MPTEETTYLNGEGTLAFTLWPDGSVTAAVRDNPSDMWNPPIELRRAGGSFTNAYGNEVE